MTLFTLGWPHIRPPISVTVLLLFIWTQFNFTMKYILHTKWCEGESHRISYHSKYGILSQKVKNHFEKWTRAHRLVHRHSLALKKKKHFWGHIKIVIIRNQSNCGTVTDWVMPMWTCLCLGLALRLFLCIISRLQWRQKMVIMRHFSVLKSPPLLFSHYICQIGYPFGSYGVCDDFFRKKEA